MKIKVKSSFIHGSVNFKRGATVDVSDRVGEAFIKAGLAVIVGAAKSEEKSTGKQNVSGVGKASGDSKPTDNKQNAQGKPKE